MIRSARRQVVCAALVAAFVALACEPSSVAPTASPSSMSCAVEVSFIDGGPDVQITGSGFRPDQPVTLTAHGPAGQATLTQATNPTLRTDIRGVVLFVLGASREDVGSGLIDLTAAGCTASATIVVLESMFPPACPTGDPIASGGTEADAYEDLILGDGPIAYWRFEEDAGPLAIATVGGAGAIQGDGVFGQPGPIPGSRALGLDGDGDWVNIVALELAGDFAIEGWMWFCGDDIDNRDALVGAEPNVNFHEATVRLWDGAMDVAWADRQVEVGRWYHVAVVRVDGEVVLYLDGKAVGSGPFEPTLPITTIGFGGVGSLTGQLDEVAFYDHALSVAQLAERVAAAGLH